MLKRADNDTDKLAAMIMVIVVLTLKLQINGSNTFAMILPNLYNIVGTWKSVFSVPPFSALATVYMYHGW